MCYNFLGKGSRKGRGNEDEKILFSVFNNSDHRFDVFGFMLVFS